MALHLPPAKFIAALVSVDSLKSRFLFYFILRVPVV